MKYRDIIGGVLAPDLQLDAGHGDQVEQDHQRPWVEPLQRQQSWGEIFRNIMWVGMFLARDEVNRVVHFVILFPVIFCDFGAAEWESEWEIWKPDK